VGNRYWRVANPLLYYGDRSLLPPSTTAEEALRVARQQDQQHVLICDRENCGDAQNLAGKTRVLLETPDWLLIGVEN
jgi:hypothetical protein